VPDTEWYLDKDRSAGATCNSGPTWNISNCYMWSRTYAGFYMTESDNNEGLQQAFNWDNLRTNQHGVDSSAAAPDNDATNPMACTDLEKSSAMGWNAYPCNVVDDNGWSHISLRKRHAVENAPTSTMSGFQLISTWNYNYKLASLTAQECSDCKVGMYWGDANNGDYLDFYNGRFTGFAFAQVVNPDNSLENDYYYSTEGWGVWNPTSVPCHDGQGTCPNAAYWHVTNAASGMPYQV